MSDTVPVRVSVASAYQRFHGCTPDFIRDVCFGRCCDAPSRPGGTLITIHPSEEAAIRARGATVERGLLVTDGRCTFKTDDHLCSLHFTEDKPFGCIASPFTLTRAGTLVVRNRYRMLPCYINAPRWKNEDPPSPGEPPKPRWPPAFIAFRASLNRIFGGDLAASLCARLITVGDPHRWDYEGPVSLDWRMPVESFDRLLENDAIKKGA